MSRRRVAQEELFGAERQSSLDNALALINPAIPDVSQEVGAWGS